MTILSDIEIERLCKLPEQIVDRKRYVELTQSHPLMIPAVHYPDPDHRPDFEGDHRRRLEAMAMRPPTQAEIDAFIPMIEPFHSNQIRSEGGGSVKENPILVDGDMMGNTWKTLEDRRVLSYGLSSYGYDVTLAEEFKIFTNINSTIIDPKRLSSEDGSSCLVDAQVHTDEDGARYVILPPNSYLLGRTVEYFRIPRDVVIIAVGKSTYARSGAIVNVTPIEPGFEGNVVIEVSNSTPSPLKIYANEGISQFMFFQGRMPCRVSYADKGGKYQGQTGLTLPRV